MLENTRCIIIIIAYIYKAPLPTGAHSALQLLTTFIMTKYTNATDAWSQADVTTGSDYKHIL